MIEEIEFRGNEAYEDFCYWTERVNLQPREIIKITVVCRKLGVKRKLLKKR